MKLKQYIGWLSQTNIFYYAITICVLSFVIRLPRDIITELFNISDLSFDGKTPETRFYIDLYFAFKSLIKAPLLETFLFQAIPFVIYRAFEINKWITISVSSLAFGAIHYYSVIYMIDTSLVGFLFMYGYILRGDKKKKPFLSTALAHSFANVLPISVLFIKQQFFM